MSESYLVEYQPYGGTCKLRHPHGEEESFISIEAFKKLQRENTELREQSEALKAMVEELRRFVAECSTLSTAGQYVKYRGRLLNKTPPQALHDREAKLALRVAEAVRDYLLNHYIVHLDMEKVVYVEAIRNLDLSDILENIGGNE